MYDSVSDNRGGPLFLQKSKLESTSLTVNRQTMFIVLRPTISRLGQIVQDTAPALNFLPAASPAVESGPEPVVEEDAEEKKPVAKKKGR